MNYNEFIKMMFDLGFDWDDIEYYWRNQEEFYELIKRLGKPLTEEEQKQKELNEYIANI